MAVIPVNRNSFLSRIKPLRPFQNLYHKFVEVGNKAHFSSNKHSVFEPGEINVTKWKKMDSRSLGITQTMVPSSPYALLKILRTRGFEAYLVGGCVRDLLLKRTPKDFDVITTADLRQVKKHFDRCQIVGRKFPICRVHVKGSVIEVSSFKTVAKHAEDKEKFLVSKMPKGCEKSDLNLWKNSMHRDFTINSLFFDPLIHKIYDYTNGMSDLLELKLRTLVPAHVSFKEDCARILRGLRIAARLGLSFSKDTETAIHKQASSILDLSESRIMMEINYMLSFGAAESSLRLLQRFHILKILLPFQAAYISQQAARSGQCDMMLMKLFSSLDNLVRCDHPSACRLWIGLLAFHQALVKKPQDGFVVLTFASVLYHQKWNKGLQFAKKYGQVPISFEPEILQPQASISDDELLKKVQKLAMHVVNSIDALVETKSLHNAMSKFPGFPCSGLVFIPKKSGQGAAQLFHVLTHELETYNKGRTSFKIDYNLLEKGDASNTRLALGKIILNTIGCEIDQDGQNHPALTHISDQKPLKNPTISPPHSRSLNKENPVAKLKKNAEKEKKIEDIVDGYRLDHEEQKEVVSKKHPAPTHVKDKKLLKDHTISPPDSRLLNKEKPVAKLKKNAAKEKKIENIVDGYGLDQEEQKEAVSKKHPAPTHVKDQKLLKNHTISPPDLRLPQPNPGESKKNAVAEKMIEDIVDGYGLDHEEPKEVVLKKPIEEPSSFSYPKVEDGAKEKPEESQSSMQKLIFTMESVLEAENFPLLETQKPKEGLDGDAELQANQPIIKEQKIDGKCKRKPVSSLSSLFR